MGASTRDDGIVVAFDILGQDPWRSTGAGLVRDGVMRREVVHGLVGVDHQQHLTGQHTRG